MTTEIIQDIELTISNPATVEAHTEHERTTKIQSICVLVSGFLANFIVFGIGFTYGIFYEFYLSINGPLYSESPSKVAMIGTLATAITYSFAIFQNYLRKHYSIYTMMVLGSIFFSLGLVLAGSCRHIWQFSLTQGVLFGIGSSLVYLPPVILAPQYFNKSRGIAMGIIFSGTGFGAFALGPFSRYLIDKIGWQWALRTLGLIGFVITLSCSYLVKACPDPSSHISDSTLLFNFSVLKNKKFLLHISCGLLQSLAYLIPTFYLSSYGTTLGFSPNQGALFIGINNAINAIAKIGLGYLSDYIGTINMLIICCISNTITVYALWLIPNRDTFISFIILYGVTSGPIIALLPAALVELFDYNIYHSITGLLYLSRGLGNALGAPIAGLMIDENNLLSPNSYKNVIQYTGAALIMTSLCSILLRLCVMKDHKWNT